MPALLTAYSNAKKSIELLQTFPLDRETKSNIRKLREMLAEDQMGSAYAKNEEKSNENQEASIAKEKIRDQNGKEKSFRFGKADACIQNEDCAEMRSEEEKQDFLTKIVEEIQLLLQINDIKAQDGMDACHHKENEESHDILGSELSTEICTLLLKISEELKDYIKHSNGVSPNQENNSNFSYNTHTNISNNSNSGSVRSLLTEKLKQFANQDFDDPECKNERVVIQGNLMRQLSKYSRGSKPMIVSRKFQDLSQPFSMQNKIVNERELQKWSKDGRKELKGRVHSQRTILGEINLSQSHLKEKRAKKSETGCSRCEIY